MSIYDRIKVHNTDGKVVNEYRKPTNVEVEVGVHKNCGGKIVFKMDNPFGTFRCKKCGRSCTGETFQKVFE